MTTTLKTAGLGSVSPGTLRPKDLLSTFMRELEWHVNRNEAFLSRPENFPLRDRLSDLIGVAQDCFSDDGETIPDEKAEEAREAISDIETVWSGGKPVLELV